MLTECLPLILLPAELEGDSGWPFSPSPSLAQRRGQGMGARRQLPDSLLVDRATAGLSTCEVLSLS